MNFLAFLPVLFLIRLEYIKDQFCMYCISGRHVSYQSEMIRCYFTITRSRWSIICSTILRVWLMSLISLYVERSAILPFSFHTEAVIFAGQAWSSWQCLRIWFIELMSHVTSAGPQNFQNSIGMPSAPDTLSFFIFIIVATFLQVTDGTEPCVGGAKSKRGWPASIVETTLKCFCHFSRISRIVTNSLSASFLTCLNRLTSSVAASLARARRWM